MIAGSASSRARAAGPGLAALWFGLLGPPILWAIRIAASYVLVPFVCSTGWIGLLHGLTAAALAGTAVAGTVAYRSWRRARRDYENLAAPGRTRFMGLGGILSATFFFAVIVAEGLANFLVDPCLGAGAPL